MNNIITNLFLDLGVELDTAYFTPKQIIVILAFVFSFEIMIRLIAALTDLMRK